MRFNLKIAKRSLVTSIILTALLLPAFTVPAAAQKTAARPTQVQTLARYPRTYQISDGSVVTIYEPQIADWARQTRMTAWSAVSYAAKPDAKPVLGSIKIEANTDVALDERLVKFNDFSIQEVNFATLSRDDARKITAALQAELPDDGKVLALDNVLAALDKSQLMPETTEKPGIKADPPIIFHSNTPAIMVAFDGEPIWSPIKDVDLKFAVNTNWDVFQYAPTNTFYLRNESIWYRSRDIKSGWVPAGTLPASFSKLPADDNWKDARASLPGKAITAGKMPKVFVTNEPAELIVLNGPPKYSPVTGTSLLWLSNTEADIFRNGPKGAFYYLVAGRWFSGPTLDGPWKFATPDLPAEFQSIPIEHPRSRVLASVPGTRQATEAVLLANIPVTARVNKSQLKAPDVVYQGEPEFQPIQETTLYRAVNTDKEIIKAGDKYFMCYQGVWFASGNAKGPWTVASEIPAEIYSIPPSSPVHNVTYVTVKADSTSSEWVYVTYVAAYTGMMVAWGCVVWGTGWYYPPYVYYRGFYPIYYPYYRTYGYAAWYNPYVGAFGRGAVVYGPYGGVGFGAVYNPRTGTYARAATAYGPYGSRSFAQAYNPRTGTYAQTRHGSNIYGSWGSSYVQRGDNWVQTGRASSRVTGKSVAGARTSSGGAIVTGSGNNGRTTVARTPGGDVYAGHDGNVYKKTGDGWQKYESGKWSGGAGAGAKKTATPAAAQKPSPNTGLGGTNSPTYNQLDRDSRARAEGAKRTNDLGSYRSSWGGRSSAGSYRGGGRSYGGGRRRH